MKVCTQCRIEKEESEFYKKRDGYVYTKCKVCFNEKCRKYRKDNPQKRRLIGRVYREKNKNSIKEKQKAYSKKMRLEINTYYRNYYANNLSYRQKRKEQWKEYGKTEVVKQKVRAYQKKNAARINKKRQERREIDPEKFKESYYKKLLVKQGLKREDVEKNPDLCKVFKAVITYRRIKNEKRKECSGTGRQVI